MKPIVINSNGDQIEAGYVVNSETSLFTTMPLKSDADRIDLTLPAGAIGGEHVFAELEFISPDTNISSGTISSIGFSTLPDWDDLIGVEVTVVAPENNSWFNVSSSGSYIPTANYKPIRRVGYEDTVREYRLTRATFRYTSTGWVLISSTALDDKYNQIRQKSYYLDYHVTGSDFVLDGNVPTGFYMHAVKGHYYKVTLSGSVNTLPANNDQSVPFSILYTQVYKEDDFNFTIPSSTKIRQREHTTVSGSKLLFEDEFLFYGADCTMTFNVTHLNNDNLSDTVTPTGSLTDFEFHVQVELLPKDEWHKHFDLVGTGVMPLNAFTIDMPVVGGLNEEFLPFDGYYHVHVYIEVEELDAAMISVNTGVSQTLSVGRSSVGAPARVIDSSVVHIPAPGAGSKVLSYSLQGSTIIELKAGEKVRIFVTLPNGVNNAVNSGYIDLNYINETTKLLKN